MVGENFPHNESDKEGTENTAHTHICMCVLYIYMCVCVIYTCVCAEL